MPFHFQQISDYGTGTPAVARTFVQGAPIVDMFNVDDAKKEQCKTVLFDLQNQFIRCHSERDAVAQQIADGLKRGAIKQPGGTYSLPGVLDLQSRCEAFLQSAKLAIRDSARLAEPFYVHSKKFDHRFDVFKKWAATAFGPDDHFTKVIENWEPYVKQVVDWRNAVDHPEPSRKLETTNFTMVLGATGPLLVEPSWCIEVGKTEPVLRSMDVIIANTLGMSENILVALFYKLKHQGFPSAIIEIPESERNPDCPIRLRVGLAQEVAQNVK